MGRCLVISLLAMGVWSLSGCSVYLAYTCPRDKDIDSLSVGTRRLFVDNELGQPTHVDDRPPYRVCSYKYTDGVPFWGNILRGTAWLAADFFTVCLAEIVTWPIELGIREAITDTASAEVWLKTNDGTIAYGVFFDDKEKTREIGVKQETPEIVARPQEASRPGQPPGDVPRPGQSPDSLWIRAKSTYAVIIGVGTYKDSSIPPISTAETDATMFKDLLVHAGVPESQMRVLIGKDATLQGINGAAPWLRGQVTKPGVEAPFGIFFFSGHGAPVTDTATKEIVEGVLVPYDAERAGEGTLAAMSYPQKKLREELEKIIQCPVLVLLDACFSDASPVHEAGPKPALTRPTKPMTVNSAGKVVLSATRGGQFANQSLEEGNGLFTSFVLKGLRGAADLDGDTVIDTDELYRYVYGGVVEAVKRNGTLHQQEPESSQEQGEPLRLMSVRKR